MANEIYFVGGAAATAIVALGILALIRARKAANSPWGRIQGGKGNVTLADLIIEYRAKKTENSLPKETIDFLEAQAKTSLKTQQSKNMLAVLIDEAHVWNRRLAGIEKRRSTNFSEESDAYLLRELWAAAFGSPLSFERKSEKWSKLGFQGVDPQTDFRGGGMLALEQFHYFATRHNDVFKQMIDFNERQGELNQNHWFLTAVVSIQFSVQLACREHPVFRRHLQVMTRGSGNDKQSPVTTTDGNVVLPSAPSFDGFHDLHADLMKYFFKRWMQDLPHVMNYTLWVPKMYEEFFNEKFTELSTGVSAK